MNKKDNQEPYVSTWVISDDDGGNEVRLRVESYDGYGITQASQVISTLKNAREQRIKREVRTMYVYHVLVVNRVNNDMLYNDYVMAKDEALALVGVPENAQEAINQGIAAFNIRQIMDYELLSTDEMANMVLQGDTLERLRKQLGTVFIENETPSE